MTSSDLWPLALIPSDHINNNLFKFFLETDIKIAPVVTLSILSPHRSCHFTFYIAFDFSHGSGAGCSWPGSGQGRIINSLLSVCVLLIAMIPSLSEVSQQLALSWGCDNAPSHETINSGHFSSCPRVVSVREVHLMCILCCNDLITDVWWSDPGPQVTIASVPGISKHTRALQAHLLYQELQIVGTVDSKLVPKSRACPYRQRVLLEHMNHCSVLRWCEWVTCLRADTQ